MPAQMDSGSEKQFLSRQYTEAIAVAGGIPIIFPLLTNPQSLRFVAESLDGLMLPGNNSDVDPAHYSECRADGCGPTQPLRDKTDFFLLEVALQSHMPILAICYGMQSLNVFLGGSLIQDIPGITKTSLRHSSHESAGYSYHEVSFVSGSLLEELAGGPCARVNSTHHQSVNLLGRGLEVIARSCDGIVEAVSIKNPDRFVFGVQWHPEKSFACDSLSQKIFEHFLARCRALTGGL